MVAELLDSPFPDIVEQKVGWHAEGKLHIDKDYRAIVDRKTDRLFSIVSPGYRIIRHEEAIEEIESAISQAPALGEYRVNTEFYNEGGRMRRDYVFLEHRVPVADDDLVNPTLTLLNSYDTTWPFSVILGAFRLVCTNGLVIGFKLFSLKKRHIYDLDELDVRWGISSALRRFSRQVKEWTGWTGRQLTPKTYAKVIQAMAFGKKGKEEVRDRMQAEARETDEKGFPIMSVWIFYNVLTWYITHRSVSLNHRVDLDERLRKALVHFKGV